MVCIETAEELGSYKDVWHETDKQKVISWISFQQLAWSLLKTTHIPPWKGSSHKVCAENVISNLNHQATNVADFAT